MPTVKGHYFISTVLFCYIMYFTPVKVQEINLMSEKLGYPVSIATLRCGM